MIDFKFTVLTHHKTYYLLWHMDEKISQLQIYLEHLPTSLPSSDHSAFLLNILGNTDEGAGSSVSTTSTNLKTMQMDSGRGKAVTHQPQDDKWSTF